MFAISGDAPLVARRAHTKSKRGCKECKKRKVKCDERRPLCENCQRRWGDIGECGFEDIDNDGGSGKPISASCPRPQPPTRLESESNRPKTESKLVTQSTMDLQALRQASLLLPPLSTTIQGHLFDPFSSRPQSHVIDSDVLIKHYFSAVVFQSFPWQPKSEKNPVTKYYAPMVLADPVMFQATLQLSALRLNTRESSFHVEYRQIMAEAIRLLNQRVRDPLLNVSDGTIGAVAIMTTIEYEGGDMKSFKMHLSGLRQMLKLRGGLAAVRQSSPMLANMVFWTFIVGMTETITLQLDPNDAIETPYWLQEARETYGPTPKLDLEAFGVTEAVTSIIMDVKYLSQRFVYHTDYVSVDECLSALTFVCNTLQRILSKPFIPISACPRASICEASRIAVALHIMTPWRGLRPDPVHVIYDLLHRLKAYLGQVLAHDPSNELLLWLLFTGGVTAFRTPEREWFAQHLVTVASDLGLNQWEDVRACLMKVVWHEILCERSYRKLWEEVKALNEDLGTTVLNAGYVL